MGSYCPEGLEFPSELPGALETDAGIDPASPEGLKFHSEVPAALVRVGAPEER